MEIAAAAAIALVVIAVVGAIASGIANYYTASVGQYIANDLRLRTYDHLQQLSLNYYSEHDLGTLLSTLTADVQTIQSFASGSTLDIVVDLLTIISMLAIMFFLNWDFTLIAVAITPFMLVIISRFKKAVKKAQKEVRKQQSNIVTVVQQGLESVRVIKAFGRQDLEQEELSEVSKATVDAVAEGAAREGDVVAAGDGCGCAVHGVCFVAEFFADFEGNDDRGGADGFSVVPGAVFQAGERSGDDDEHDRADGGRRRSDSGDSECRAM